MLARACTWLPHNIVPFVLADHEDADDSMLVLSQVRQASGTMVHRKRMRHSNRNTAI